MSILIGMSETGRSLEGSALRHFGTETMLEFAATSTVVCGLCVLPRVLANSCTVPLYRTPYTVDFTHYGLGSVP